MTTTELAEAIKSVEAIRNRATASETRALLYRIALAKYAKEGYSEQIRKADYAIGTGVWATCKVKALKAHKRYGFG